MERFKLSEIQAKAILDMRLQRLTGLERKKIENEYKELIKLIEKLRGILESEEKRNLIIKEELIALRDKFGDERRTEIIYDYENFSLEDMIAEEDVVVTISHRGFIKRFPASGYRKQKRGGRGVTGAGTKEGDFVETMFVASTHHYIMFFTDKGRCYWLKVHEVPDVGRSALGRSILNLIEKTPDEQITAFVTVKEFKDDQFLIMATKNGIIKKTVLSAYGNVRRGGIIALNLNEGDSLISAKLCETGDNIIIGTHDGIAIRFDESAVRDMGRAATGVIGIRLEKGDFVVGSLVIKRTSTVMVVTDKGYGKRSDVNDYRITNRGGKGIITVKTTEKTGKLMSIMELNDNDELICITSGGMVIKMAAKDIRTMGRNTQGVRIINLKDHDSITDIAKVVPDDDETAGENGDAEETLL